jgi:hypothetical protein
VHLDFLSRLDYLKVVLLGEWLELTRNHLFWSGMGDVNTENTLDSQSIEVCFSNTPELLRLANSNLSYASHVSEEVRAALLTKFRRLVSGPSFPSRHRHNVECYFTLRS